MLADTAPLSQELRLCLPTRWAVQWCCNLLRQCLLNRAHPLAATLPVSRIISVKPAHRGFTMLAERSLAEANVAGSSLWGQQAAGMSGPAVAVSSSSKHSQVEVTQLH